MMTKNVISHEYYDHVFFTLTIDFIAKFSKYRPSSITDQRTI